MNFDKQGTYLNKSPNLSKILFLRCVMASLYFYGELPQEFFKISFCSSVKVNRSFQRLYERRGHRRNCFGTQALNTLPPLRRKILPD